jgi:hypothetical protein
VIFCLTCGVLIFGKNPSNDDGIVILIHAMAGHELEELELP